MKRAMDVRGKVTLAAPLVALLLGVIAALSSLSPRPPRGDDAPAAAFSAGRARRHVEALAVAPRPAGSAAHKAAREWLLRELSHLGAEVDARPADAVSTFYGVPFDSGRVWNVAGRLRGRASTGAVLLVAHYDTVPGSPGAADDASGVAAILEILRAARAAGPLRNDVIALFTDGEEGGMIGATAFADAHPWAGDVGVLVNFDARGTRGLPVIVGLSAPGGWLAEHVAEAGVTTQASSLFTAATRIVHPGTDFGLLASKGFAGINIAFADGVASYHAGADRPAALDPGTLQAEGDLGLALLRRLGEADLGPSGRAARAASGDRAFFSLGPIGLLSYSIWGAALLGVLAIGLVAACFARSHSRFRVGAVAKVVSVHLAAALAAGLLVRAVWLAISWGHPVYRHLRGDPYDPGALRAGAVLAGVTAAIVAGRLTLSMADRRERALAGLVLGGVLSFALLAVLLGGSHVAVLPLLAGAGWFLAADRTPDDEDEGMRDSAVAIGVAAAAALVTGYFGAQMAYLVLLAGQMPGAGLAAGAVVVFAALVPALPWADSHARWLNRAAAATGLLAGGTLVWASATARFDERRPLPTCGTYALDATSRKAFWMSEDRHPSAWSSVYAGRARLENGLDAFFADPGRSVLGGPAEVHNVQAPRLVAVRERSDDGRRTIDLRLTSPRGAPWVFVIVTSDTPVLGASVGGRAVDPAVVTRPLPAGERWSFRHVGLGPEGLAFSLVVPAGSELRVRVVDQTFELHFDAAEEREKLESEALRSAACRSWMANSILVSAEHTF